MKIKYLGDTTEGGMSAREICRNCPSGGEIIINNLGFSYRLDCKVFLCPCGAPLKASKNGQANCTYCGNSVVAESLIYH